LKLHVLAEAVLWKSVAASVDQEPVIPAVAYHGKEERRASAPEARIALPDVFFSAAVF